MLVDDSQRAAAARGPGARSRQRGNPPRAARPASQMSGSPMSAVGSWLSMHSKERDPQRFGLEAAGAVEGLLARHVALDLRRGERAEQDRRRIEVREVHRALPPSTAQAV